MAETGCATCDGTQTPCTHCWHSRVLPNRTYYDCCRCAAVACCAVDPVPGYRNEWATPPSTAFRRKGVA